MKKLTLIPTVLGLASIVLAVVSFLLLPDVVVTQFSAGSSDVSTMPKLYAVGIATLLGVGGAAAAVFSDGTAKNKFLVISAAGVAVFAIMLFVNL